MDIAKFQLGGEWLDLQIESAKGEDKSLRVKVKPFSDMDKYNIRQLLVDGKVGEFSGKIIDLILDWDLTEGKDPLKCTKENKEAYLPYLVGMPLVEVEKQETDEPMDEKEDGELPKKKIRQNVGFAILGFASDFNNFIKN